MAGFELRSWGAKWYLTPGGKIGVLPKGRSQWRLGVEGNPDAAKLPPDYIISSHSLPYGKRLKPRVIKRDVNNVMISMEVGSKKAMRDKWLAALSKKFPPL